MDELAYITNPANFPLLDMSAALRVFSTMDPRNEFRHFSRLPRALRLRIWNLAVRPNIPAAHFLLAERLLRIQQDPVHEPRANLSIRHRPAPSEMVVAGEYVPWASICMLDAGLWTACRESRRAIAAEFRRRGLMASVNRPEARPGPYDANDPDPHLGINGSLDMICLLLLGDERYGYRAPTNEANLGKWLFSICHIRLRLKEPIMDLVAPTRFAILWRPEQQRHTTGGGCDEPWRQDTLDQCIAGLIPGTTLCFIDERIKHWYGTPPAEVVGRRASRNATAGFIGDVVPRETFRGNGVTFYEVPEGEPGWRGAEHIWRELRELRSFRAALQRNCDLRKKTNLEPVYVMVLASYPDS